MFHVKM